MTTGGWIMMVSSWALIIGISAFCLKRVIELRDTKARHIKPVLDIDTGDLDEDK